MFDKPDSKNAQLCWVFIDPVLLSPSELYKLMGYFVLHYQHVQVQSDYEKKHKKVYADSLPALQRMSKGLLQ